MRARKERSKIGNYDLVLFLVILDVPYTLISWSNVKPMAYRLLCAYQCMNMDAYVGYHS